MNLYFVSDKSDPDLNMDLFVKTTDADNAVAFWQTYFGIEDQFSPEEIFLIDPNAPAGPLNWHTDVCKPIWSKT